MRHALTPFTWIYKVIFVKCGCIRGKTDMISASALTHCGRNRDNTVLLKAFRNYKVSSFRKFLATPKNSVQIALETIRTVNCYNPTPSSPDQSGSRQKLVINVSKNSQPVLELDDKLYQISGKTRQ
ncbi:hypothetical protein CAPTEDRAFT_213623 [Capitella teleta]|uniref:Uncharacterized protein n=1 Tax=Capitella teleta TaxID=283909 RepID=R7VCV8_CAPTE|nr:hypothetical protein CAPTEDRAFT_213623 [Capitella teleta]|eukprot:ELU16402.1 hypothetical protein CAPTEDRAFT_213623 [Capitella teleta]